MSYRQFAQDIVPRGVSQSDVIPTDSRPRRHERRHRSDAMAQLDPLGPSLFGGTLFGAADPFGLGRLASFGFNDFGLDGSMGSMICEMPMDSGGMYQSQVMMMSSTIGPDGRRHVEKYAKSAVGNTKHKMREVQEAYTNSLEGVDRMAQERQMDRRAHRIMKERNRRTGEMTTNDEIAGMERGADVDQFRNEWQHAAPRYLPKKVHQLGISMNQQLQQAGHSQQEQPLLQLASGGYQAPQAPREVSNQPPVWPSAAPAGSTGYYQPSAHGEQRNRAWPTTQRCSPLYSRQG